MEGVEETKSHNRKRSFKDANIETSNKHSKTYCQASSTHNTNKNAEKQRRYMERLQKPENKDELIAYRQKKECKAKRIETCQIGK